MEPQNTATLEKPSDAGKGQEGIVNRWLLELDMADKREKKWRKRAKKTIDRYRDDVERKSEIGGKFNILWANTEILKSTLYNSTPRPDVRGRFKNDPIAKQAADVLETCLRNNLDEYDFDHTMDLTVSDICLPGRGVPRVVFEPVFETAVDPQTNETFDRLTYAKLYCENVEWDKLRIGPGKKWSDVPWIALEHMLDRAELKEKFGEMGSAISLDCEIEGKPEDTKKTDEGVFKRARVWEIWDKTNKKVLFIAPSHTDAPLKEEDGYGLLEFFPIPRPVYSIYTSDSLIPIEEYRMYIDQAAELDRVSQRINKLVEGLKVRGIYDSTISEMKKLETASDNEFIPSEDAKLAMAAGGLDKGIWMMPIEQIAAVLNQLYLARDQIKQVIYEITGISDILRGSTDPNETLGAQQLKAQSGSTRIMKRQREVQRLVKDIFRMKSEIMAENYTPELLQMMSGQQITPEVLAVLKGGDLQRNFRIDVETDSTIAADQSAERRDLSELLEAMSGFIGAVGPAVKEGAIPQEAAKAMLMAVVSKFKMGRVVEDALDELEGQEQQEVDPAVAQAQAQAQADMEVQQMKIQSEQAVNLEKVKSDHTIKQMQIQSDAAYQEQELAAQERQFAQEMALKRELGLAQIAANAQAKTISAEITAQSKGDSAQ